MRNQDIFVFEYNSSCLSNLISKFFAMQRVYIKNRQFFRTWVSNAKTCVILEPLLLHRIAHPQHIITDFTDRIMKIKKYFTPLAETYKMLQKFYAPFNKRLAEMLNNQRWLTWETELDNLIKQKTTSEVAN